MNQSIDSTLDYICFTDNANLKSDKWKICLVDNEEGLDNVRLARKYKILCHRFLSEYDYSVYVDGKIEIIGDMKEYINKYSMGRSLLCFPHFVRECMYEEARACLQFEKDNADIINRQVKAYKEDGYPENNGMIDSACLVRSHQDKELCIVMENWWDEVHNGSRRDQLSFGYVCWKQKYTYDLCDLFIYDNDYVCKKRTWEPPY